MNATSTTRNASPTAIGVVLVIVGLVTLALQQSGVDVIKTIDRIGWPLFVIIPGLVLFTAAWIPEAPRGIGFAVGGAIVTTVGLILMYAVSTGHWERWAYLWALLPAAAGAATLVYGAVMARRELVVEGLRTVAIAAVVFAAAMWFFESTFEAGQPPVDVEQWWPVVLIGIGLLVTLSAVFSAPQRSPVIPPFSSEEKPR